MNSRLLLSAVIAATVAGPAIAETPTVLQDGFASTRSREAVQSEFVAFRKAGVNPWSAAYDPLKSFVSARTREAVTAEYIAARAEVAAMSAEDSGSAWTAVASQAPETRTLGASR